MFTMGNIILLTTDMLSSAYTFLSPFDGSFKYQWLVWISVSEIEEVLPILSGESYYRGDKIDSSKFGADPGLPSEVTSEVESPPNEGKSGTSAFRCKKCRRLVAVQDNVVDHIPGQGETSFEWRKRKSSNYNNFEDSECSSIFVEPLKWMTAGKIRSMNPYL